MTERDIGRSLLFYPLVGLIIGLLLATLNLAISEAPDGIQAALLLAAWVLVTGGLHLDGLADSADAWIGGLGDRERTLAIMKDPSCGPAGAVALALVLIMKFSALEALVSSDDWTALILVPLLARMTLPLLFLTTPYVRPGGLGSLLSRRLPRPACAAVLAATAIAVPPAAGRIGLYLLLVVAVVFLFFRALMRRRIGGATGDTAGALVELAETAALITAQML